MISALQLLSFSLSVHTEDQSEQYVRRRPRINEYHVMKEKNLFSLNIILI